MTGKSKTLPEGIEHLSGLQRLHLREMPEEFIERLRADTSQVRKNGSAQPNHHKCYLERRETVL